MSFQANLERGKTGEGRIANWLISRGHCVLPVYEKEANDFKGPTLFTSEGTFVAPDMLVFKKDGKATWIEAKTKGGFTWHRISRRWVTGIDLHHYADYLKIARLSAWPIWLLFLHETPEGAKDTPQDMIGKSPVGLFGNELLKLAKIENHRHENRGKNGMVYWAHESLLELPDFFK